jgi:hypothetical protein
MLRKALDGGRRGRLHRPRRGLPAARPDQAHQTQGDVVAGLYRFKKPDEEYMGQWRRMRTASPGPPEDGAIEAVARAGGLPEDHQGGVERFMRAYPELIYGDPISPHVDLFNHGAHEGVWWGEDYAFSRRWLAMRRGDLGSRPRPDPPHSRRSLPRQPARVPDAPARRRTTCRDAITRALRFLSVVSEGQPAANAYDAQNGLEALKNVYLEFISAGRFGPITNVLASANYTANENERVTKTTTLTVTLPTTITDTDACGNSITRAPYDRSVVIEAGSSTYLYDADLAGWQTIETLTLDSDLPLGRRYFLDLSALIAIALPELGDPPPFVAAMAQSARAKLRAKPPIKVSAEAPVLRTLARGFPRR